MKTSTPETGNLNDFVDRKDYSGLEGAWIEGLASLQGSEESPAPFLQTADLLLARGEKDRATMLLELLLPISTQRGPDMRLAVLRRLVISSSPSRKTDHRAAFSACFKEVHRDHPAAEACLTIAGIDTSTDQQKSLALLDRLLHYRPGKFVYHASGWGVGMVESVDPALRQAVVNLEKKPNHRVDLKAAADILEPLADDHLRVLARDGGKKLRALAESDPSELIRVVLASFGNPMPLKSIKSHLVPIAVTAEGWSKWWNRAKLICRESGFYRVGDKSPFVVERLAASVSYEDELLRQFESADFSLRLAIARKHGRDRSAAFARLREKIIAYLRNAASGGPVPTPKGSADNGVSILEAALVLEKVADGEGETQDLILGVLRSAANVADAVLGVEGGEERRRAVDFLQEALGDAWVDAALQVLSRGDDTLRDQTSRLLEKSPSAARATSLVAEAVRQPRNFPDLFAWACRAYMEEQQSPLLESLRSFLPKEVLGRMFDVVDHLGMRSARDGKAVVRDSLARMRSLFTLDDAAFFRKVIQPLIREDVRAIYQRVISSGGLSDPLRVRLLEILMLEFPDITRPVSIPVWEEDFIYTTEGGLSKKQAEFRDIMEEKLPKNFQDIGRAAAFGDLSENAEYTYALEERDRLTKKATEIKSQLDKVRPILPDMLKEGEVTLGSRLRLENMNSGREVAYRILGPWDGGPEDGVLSYRSPLAMCLLGKKLGEEVEAQLPGGVEKFKILEIGSAFE